MGLIAAIIGWLQYHLGLRTDAASAGGSLHAKIGDIKNTIINQIAIVLGTVQKPRTLAVGQYTMPASENSAQYTVLNVSGKGKLNGLRIYGQSAYEPYFIVSIYIDGVLMSSTRIDNYSGNFFPGPDFFWPMSYYTGSGSSRRNLSGWVVAQEVSGSSSYTDYPYVNQFIGYLGIPFKTSLRIDVYKRGNNPDTIYWAYEYE